MNEGKRKIRTKKDVKRKEKLRTRERVINYRYGKIKKQKCRRRGSWSYRKNNRRK